MANRGARRVLPVQEPLWEAYYRRFTRHCGDPEIAADLLQHLRLKVLHWMQREGSPDSMHALLEVAYANILRDWLRSKMRSHEVRKNGDDDGNVAEPDIRLGSDERLIREEWRTRVRDEFGSVAMSETLRAVLLGWEEDAESLAVRLRTTPGAVWNYRDRLKRRLKCNRRLRKLLREAPGW